MSGQKPMGLRCSPERRRPGKPNQAHQFGFIQMQKFNAKTVTGVHEHSAAGSCLPGTYQEIDEEIEVFVGTC